MVTGLSARPFEEAAVGAILLVLVRQRRAVAEQELRAHQADAVAAGGIDVIELVHAGDIDQ